MTVTAVNYAKTLYELSVPAEAVQTTKEIFREVPGLNSRVSRIHWCLLRQRAE